MLNGMPSSITETGLENEPQNQVDHKPAPVKFLIQHTIKSPLLEACLSPTTHDSYAHRRILVGAGRQYDIRDTARCAISRTFSFERAIFLMHCTYTRLIAV